MLSLRVFARLTSGALLALTASCSSSGSFSGLNPLSLFKKSTDAETSAESSDAPTGEDGESAPSGSVAEGSHEATQADSGETPPNRTLAGDNQSAPESLNWNPGTSGDGGFPLIVKPRQPSVYITPPTSDENPGPASPQEDPDEPEPEPGGLRPRNPTLDIVLPDSN